MVDPSAAFMDAMMPAGLQVCLAQLAAVMMRVLVWPAWRLNLKMEGVGLAPHARLTPIEGLPSAGPDCL